MERDLTQQEKSSMSQQVLERGRSVCEGTICWVEGKAGVSSENGRGFRRVFGRGVGRGSEMGLGGGSGIGQ